jgi:methylated-DNA-[protein]-cysteine S-methyltransferase
LRDKKQLFSEQIYDLTSQIPNGKVTTYGVIARRLRKPRAARAVGRVLAANPHPIVVPCHRVVRGDGTLGGYSGGKGIETKVELLQSEGVDIQEGKVNLSRFLFKDFEV